MFIIESQSTVCAARLSIDLGNKAVFLFDTYQHSILSVSIIMHIKQISAFEPYDYSLVIVFPLQ